MIDVDGLSYTYPGSTRPAVQNMCFQVGRGEIFGFLGPSGAGKSTTQKVLVGILKNYAGRVAMMGRELREWGRDFYERIGVSFELPNHYLKLTALENLNLFGSLYRGETEDPHALLEQLGLGDDANTPVGAFSKGMQMRLNLARALLHKPELLFLDEPTTGLDPANARNVRRMVFDLKARGRTIFLTTHDMHVADELCDRVAFMVDGSIGVIESPRALKFKYGQPTVRVEYRNGAANVVQEFPLPGIGANERFLTLIREAEVETIHTQEATLEDVFLSVTGRSLA